MTAGEAHPLDFHDDPLRLGVAPAPGHVWLVGAGPGDAGLVTVRGWCALLACDVVVHDRLGCEEILCRVPESVRRVNVGKQPGERAMTQDRINAILAEEAQNGARVVRLKGGDPFVFGRGSEEVAYLRGLGIPVRIVPGVSSSIAGPGSIGVPVTHRAVARHFVISTGRDENGRVPEGTSADTRLYLMGIEALPEIVAQLRSSGISPETPAVVVASASTYRQRHVRATLGTIEAAVTTAAIVPPAVLLIGETAGPAVAPHLPPEQGAVLVTGSRVPPSLAHAAPDATILWRPLFGARFLENPTPDLQRASAPEAWVLLHGVPSVEGWLHELHRAGRDLRSVRARIGAVGAEAARALERWRIHPDATFSHEDEAGLRRALAGSPVWLAAEADYRGGLLRRFNDAGAASAAILPVYRWVDLQPGAIDWPHVGFVSLTSPRALRRFREAFPEAPYGSLTALCVGHDLMTKAAEAGFRTVVPLE